MNKHYAKVMVNLPIDGPFDYRVPAAMAENIQLGCRVWVGFGPRRLIGYVVGFCESTEVKNPKDILTLIDTKPVLSKEMLSFTKELAVY